MDEFNSIKKTIDKALSNELAHYHVIIDNEGKNLASLFIKLCQLVFQKNLKNIEGYMILKEFYAANKLINIIPYYLKNHFKDGEMILQLLLERNEYQVDFKVASSLLNQTSYDANNILLSEALNVLRKYSKNETFEKRRATQIQIDLIEGKYFRLDDDLRQDLRLFGFYLFNHTLDWDTLCENFDEDYVQFLAKNPLVFGEVSCIFINHLRNNSSDSQIRAAQWIRLKMDSSYHVDFDDWELNMEMSDQSFWSDLKRFVLAIANENFHNDLLGEAYFSSMVEQGSNFLESVFAVWGNVIRLNEQGETINTQQLELRVAQWIKSYLDESYQPYPVFEAWEYELI